MRLAPTLAALCFAACAWAADATAPATATNLPTGWAVADIGASKSAGAASYDAATKAFTVASAGEVTESRMTFVYKKMKGDFTITARITAQSKDAIASGVMVRAGAEANSRHIRIGYQDERYGGGPGVSFSSSDSSSAIAPGDIAYKGKLPCWVRLVRVGDAVASYSSVDGKEWTQHHFGGVRFHPGLPEEVLVGVANAQHDSNAPTESATIDNVTITEGYKPAYVSSWLGNSFASNYYQGHVQMQVLGMCIDRSGAKPTLRVTGQNEGLDSSVYDLDGSLMWMYQAEHGGSPCIAADGGFIFEATGGCDNGLAKLKRFDATNNNPEPDTGGRNRNSMKVNDSALSLVGGNLTGLGAAGGRLYVAEANSSRVVILDGKTMAEVGAFPVPFPGSLALDGKGGMWVVERPGKEASHPYAAKDGEKPEVKGTNFNYRPTGKPFAADALAKIHYFTLDGKQVKERTIDLANLPNQAMPTAIAVSPVNGNIYLCDVGPSQCVWIFDSKTGKQIGTLGTVGGVYKNTIPGRVDATHLFFPRAITLDDSGNIYVAMCPREGWVGGNLMRKYDPTGTKVMWERQGLEFNECADADPGTDGTDVFSQINHYKLDFTKKPGQEATFLGLTYDPFTYPHDRRNATHGGAVNATVVRTVKGQRFLYYHIWARHGEALYRFNKGSDIAIPCGEVSNDGVWVDSNGNSLKDDGESFGKLPDGAGYGQSWVVDVNGDIWSGGYKEARCWRMQGINDKGAPIFTSKPTETYPLPTGMTEISYAIYDTFGDRLFLGGFTKERPKDSHDHGGAIGTTMVALSGVRAGKSTELWRKDMPYEAGSQGLGGETNCMFTGTYAGDAKGGYLFVGGLSEKGIKKTMIWAMDPATGAIAERFQPGPEVAGYNGWFDFNNTVNVVKRSDGHYLLLAEDNGAQKTALYHWKPAK